MTRNDHQKGETDIDDRADIHFGTILGLEYLQAPAGNSHVELHIRKKHCNLHGTVHGGVIMSLLDVAGLRAGVPVGTAQVSAATVSINCNFLSAARHGEATSLMAKATVTKQGKSLFFSTISAYEMPSGKVIASGTGIYSLVRPKPSA